MKLALAFLCFLWLGSTALAESILPISLPWMNDPGTTEENEVLFNSTDYPDGIFVIEAYFGA